MSKNKPRQDDHAFMIDGKNFMIEGFFIKNDDGNVFINISKGIVSGRNGVNDMARALLRKIGP